jgi:DNA-binding response OmpR family regulator
MQPQGQLLVNTVLLVEDDLKLAQVVRDYLQGNGYAVEVEMDGDLAPGRILSENPDVVILDINLPGLNGFDICRKVRQDYQGAIIILTARMDDVDEVLGLELGADDYLSKPVRPTILLARLGIHLRRKTSSANQDELIIRVGNLEIHPRPRLVKCSGELSSFKHADFDLLSILAKKPGNTITRADLFQLLHPTEEYSYFDRSIDLRISRLRRRLSEIPDCNCRILSIRGNGYMLVFEP